MRTFLVAILTLLAAYAHAGTEAEVAYTQGGDGGGQVSIGHAWDHAWTHFGLREGLNPFAALGPRVDAGWVDLRAGLLVASHDAGHTFGDGYGTDEDTAYGTGGMAEVAVNLDPYQPFARYQIINVNHDYSAVRKVGADANGNPIYGDPVSHSETNTVDEVVIGIRISY